jgi:hypothetical protein
MVDFQMLQMNMETNLTFTVGYESEIRLGDKHCQIEVRGCVLS